MTRSYGQRFDFENQIMILRIKIVIFDFDLKSVEMNDFDLKSICSRMILNLRR